MIYLHMKLLKFVSYDSATKSYAVIMFRSVNGVHP